MTKRKLVNDSVNRVWKPSNCHFTTFTINYSSVHNAGSVVSVAPWAVIVLRVVTQGYLRFLHVGLARFFTFIL